MPLWRTPVRSGPTRTNHTYPIAVEITLSKGQCFFETFEKGNFPQHSLLLALFVHLELIARHIPVPDSDWS
jgi:hypothetical protein